MVPICISRISCASSCRGATARAPHMIRPTRLAGECRTRSGPSSRVNVIRLSTRHLVFSAAVIGAQQGHLTEEIALV